MEIYFLMSFRLSITFKFPRKRELRALSPSQCYRLTPDLLRGGLRIRPSLKKKKNLKGIFFWKGHFSLEGNFFF